MKKNKLGFTLVELLAVVLIIGILTSIGLPQYRRSVSRAEAMEAMVNLRTIFDSARRFRATNSESPKRLRGLDVSFFDATDEDSDAFEIGRFKYVFQKDQIMACRINGNYCFHMYYTRSFEYKTEKGEHIIRKNSKGDLFCTIEPGGKYDWICDALGTGKLDDKEWIIDR
ncbi:type IV pilin protein [Candidatus Avelusimicrobium luingense]|uniref:type IV pilin protein n=1 Tax=Candidatus Avelusimicrobium luingense TaxID=3416211 RepID=UPI003D111D9A